MSPIVESCCKRLCNVPSRTLSAPQKTFRKPSMATCPAGTMIVLCSLHAYEKMLDLSSVCCSFGLQSFHIFVKRSGSHSVPAVSVLNHQAPTFAYHKKSSTRESDTATDSPIERHCNKWEQVPDDGMGMSKIAWWVSNLLFCPEPVTEWAKIGSLKPAASASSRRKREAG